MKKVGKKKIIGIAVAATSVLASLIYDKIGKKSSK